MADTRSQTEEQTSQMVSNQGVLFTLYRTRFVVTILQNTQTNYILKMGQIVGPGTLVFNPNQTPGNYPKEGNLNTSNHGESLKFNTASHLQRKTRYGCLGKSSLRETENTLKCCVGKSQRYGYYSKWHKQFPLRLKCQHTERAFCGVPGHDSCHNMLRRRQDCYAISLPCSETR